jgi:hypothetical protein
VPVVSSTRASLCVLTHETQFSVLAWGWSSLGVVSLMTRVSTFGLYTVGSESKGLLCVVIEWGDSIVRLRSE